MGTPSLSLDSCAILGNLPKFSLLWVSLHTMEMIIYYIFGCYEDLKGENLYKAICIVLGIW